MGQPALPAVLKLRNKKKDFYEFNFCSNTIGAPSFRMNEAMNIGSYLHIRVLLTEFLFERFADLSTFLALLLHILDSLVSSKQC